MMDAKQTKLEIAGLETAKRHLVKAAAKLEIRCAADREKWEARQQQLAGFESFEAAQDAYAYDIITLDELHAIQEGFDQTPPETKYTIAKKVMLDYLHRLDAEIRDHQWGLLSETDKQRINADHERLAARIAERKESSSGLH